MEQSSSRKESLIISSFSEKILSGIIDSINIQKKGILSIFPLENQKNQIRYFQLPETDRNSYWLSFAEVDNEVLFVNPEVYTPLKLEEGQPTPLGVFVEAAVNTDPGVTGGRHHMQYVEGHHRSMTIGQVLFADKEGRVYRDIDLKGVGYMGDLLNEVLVTRPGKEHPQGGRYGLVERDTAFPDYDMSEQFLKAGIRTYRILGIVGLKELAVDGQKITLEEAVKAGIIDEDFHPVLEVRGFGTKTRIAEAGKIRYAARALKDAKSLVAKELAKEDMSDQEYLEWFAKTLATNVALMHKNGWYHKYLSSHNITLDCRIVDLDSVSSLSSEVERSEDFYSGQFDLEQLVLAIQIRNMIVSNRGNVAKDVADMKKIYQETYDQVFPEEERTEYFKAVA